MLLTVLNVLIVVTLYVTKMITCIVYSYYNSQTNLSTTFVTNTE